LVKVSKSGRKLLLKSPYDADFCYGFRNNYGKPILGDRLDAFKCE